MNPTTHQILATLRTGGMLGLYHARPAHGDTRHDLERILAAEARRRRRGVTATAQACRADPRPGVGDLRGPARRFAKFKRSLTA